MIFEFLSNSRIPLTSHFLHSTVITFLLQEEIHVAPAALQEVHVIDSIDLNKEHPVEWPGRL